MITNLQYQLKSAGKLVHTRPYFGSVACMVVLLINFLSCEHSLHAQVRVTGHVFAEIVEPTALSAKAKNTHFVEPAGTTNKNELVLAEIKLGGGPNLNIDVAVVTGNLVAANGEIIPFDAFVCPGCTEQNPSNDSGEKLFILKASPGTSPRQKINTFYNCRYSVVFMYN